MKTAIPMGLATASALALAVPSVAEARGCHEVSDLVGYHRCSHFGASWSTEGEIGLEMEIGLGYLRLDPTHRTLHGSFGKGSLGSYEYPGSLVGHGMSALPLDIRIGFAFTPWLYAGAEVDLGAGSDRLPATIAGKYTLAASSTGVNAFGFGGGGYVGLRLPLSYFALRGEALFGGRGIDVNQNASTSGSPARTAQSSLLVGIVEPRFFADFWVDPYVTVSVYAGFNALGLGDRIGGLMLGVHGKAYEGAFAAW